MSKRTKASRKRLNNLLIILLLTAVLLVMSTYAWFTANRTVNIDLIDVKVSTKSGLQISADGENWKTVLDKDDLITAHAIGFNQLPEYMEPVSTALTVDTNGHLEMFYGEISTDLTEGSPTYGDYLLESVLQTDIDSEVAIDDGTDYYKGRYIAFDIFLRDDAPSSTLYMSGSVEEDIEDGATAKQLENAARIALIKGGNTSNALDVDAVLALTTIGGTAMLWEPNNDCHTEHGVDNATEYGISGITEGSGNARVDYDGLLSAFTGSDAMELFSATLANTPTATSKLKTMTYSATPTVGQLTWSTTKSGTPSLAMPASTQDGDGNLLSAGATRYRIYMWVEGQDVDCENYASGTGLLYNLSFSLDEY